MIKDGTCPECGSDAIIPAVRVLDRQDGPIPNDLSVAIREVPRQLLLFTWHSEFSSPLRAWICGACGYTALFVDHPHDLWAHYQQQQNEDARPTD